MRVVALAGFHRDGGAFYADFQFVVGRGTGDVAGNVRQSVFMARFFSDLGIELFDVGAAGGVINVAAGIVRVVREALEFLFGEAAADGKAVDRNIVLEQGAKGVVVADVIELGTVHAIGNDKDYFTAGGAAVVEELCCGVNGVVERFGRTGTGFDRS